MNPPNREVALFSLALEMDASQRAVYLDKVCADDPALRQHLEALLRVHQKAITFLEGPAAGAQPPTELTAPGDLSWILRTTPAPAEKAGDRIGRYKLLQQIGEGGCGVVYMAEQEEPVRRRVALKVIKLGMDTKQVIARFEAERQALALMDHPNIAKVLDAGATDTGRPYFVMELVRGIKITDYCDEKKLSAEERLKLFIQVCQAIQHAHQKGIIHRDIKPSNILVTISEPGSPGCPKVIDFGIAKATTGQHLTDKTVFTAFEQFMGTPAYMSPEQAMMTSLDIDTRTDIYALGVLLYELLTGQTPFDAKELMAAGLDAMRRIIREQEPMRPSTRLSTMLAADLSIVAGHRHAEPARLGSVLRGDLDWIVMKCLEKDRARRYETANGLATDVLRHLKCEPVVARPPGGMYRFQKLVRRNKLAFAAVAAIATALLLGIMGSMWEAARARMEAAKATAVSDFLQQSLRSADPEELKGSDYTVRKLLDDFSSGLENQFRNQPEVEAEVRATLGRAYYRLGLADKSQPQMERSLLLRRRVFGNRKQVAATLVDYAWTSFEQHQFAKGESQAREALDIYRKRGTSTQIISALWVLQNNLIQAGGRDTDVEAVTEEALKIAGKTPGVEFPDLASILHGLGEIRIGQSRYAEAVALEKKAVAMHKRLRREGDLETAWALYDLGNALRGEQKLDEAEHALREALGVFRKQYAPGHKSVDLAMEYLKQVLEAKGDVAGLAALERERLAEASQRMLRNEAVPQAWMQLCLADADRKEWQAATQHFGVTIGLCKDQGAAATKAVGEACLQLAGRAEDAGQHEIAERVARQAVVWFRPLAQGDPKDNILRENLANSLHLLTAISYSEGKWAEAEESSVEAIGLFKRLAHDSPTRNDYAGSLAHSQWQLANVMVRQGRLDQAELVLRDTLEVFEKGTRDFPNVPYFQQEQRFSRQLLGDVLNQLGRVDEAVASHREAIALFTQIAEADPKHTEYVIDLGHEQWRLAEVLTSAGRRKQAEPVLRASLEVFDKGIRDFPDSRPLRQEQGLSRRRLADALSGLGRTEDAERLYRVALETYAALAADAPQQAVYRIDQASTTWGLVGLLIPQNKLTEAEKICRVEVESCDKAKHEFPENSAIHNEQAEGHRWLGTVLGQLRRVDEAEAEYRASIALYPWLNAAAPGNAFYRQEEAYATWMLGEMLEGAGRLEAAETEYRQAISLHEKASADFPTEAAFRDRLVSVRSRLVELLRRSGRLAEAIAIARQAAQKLQTAAAHYGNLASDGNGQRECWILAISCEAVGELLRGLGLTQEAEKVYRDAQALWRKLVASAQTEDYRFHLAVNHDALGYLLRDAGRATESLDAYRAAQAIWVKLAADLKTEDCSNHLAGTLVSLATALQSAGSRTEAELAFREVLEHAGAQTLNDLAWELATGPDPTLRDGTNAIRFAEKAVVGTNRTNHAYLDTLAAAYAEAGQFTNAVRAQQEAIALLRDEPEKQDYASRLKLYQSDYRYRDHGLLAERTLALLETGRLTEAEVVAHECLALREMQIPDEWRTFNARSMLGASLMGQKKYAEAEPYLLSGCEGMKQRDDKIPPESRPRLIVAMERLVKFYQTTDRPEQAADWKRKLELLNGQAVGNKTSPRP